MGSENIKIKILELNEKTQLLILTIAVMVIMPLCFFLTFLLVNSPEKKDSDNSFLFYNEQLEKSIPGNFSGNLIQPFYSNIMKMNTQWGTVCIKNNIIYSYKETGEKENIKRYLIKTKDGEKDGVPILTDYMISYLNIVDDKLYFLAKPSETDFYRIYSLSSEGYDLKELKGLDGVNINSLCTDSNYLYYTIENKNGIYSLNIDTLEEKTFILENSRDMNTVLMGINSQNIYYFNDKFLGRYDVQTQKNELITKKCTSYKQSPMLTDTGLVYFESLSRDVLNIIDYDTLEERCIFNSSQIPDSVSRTKKIDVVNYSSQYLFFNVGNSIYYADIINGSAAETLKNIKYNGENVYLSREYLVLQSENGVVYDNINWLLSN